MRACGSGDVSEIPEAQIMCEELFECESLLTGVSARINAREICIWWWLMQVEQRIEQRGHVVLLANFIGQQFIGRRGLRNR